jgi:hypothetical protein
VCFRRSRLIFFGSGEFSLYDHVLDHSTAFNVVPKRYVGHGLSPLDVYFAMGRGRQAEGVDVPACEMKKWYVPSINLCLVVLYSNTFYS